MPQPASTTRTADELVFARFAANDEGVRGSGEEGAKGADDETAKGADGEGAKGAGHESARGSDDTAAGIELFCLPYAGGGAQVFRSWQTRLPPHIRVTGIRLPGREQRFRERPLDTWPEALLALTEAVAPETERGPYAFFGHSLGARLAYELTHRLLAEGCRPPQLLVVSACRAPGVPPRWPPMHTMDRPTLTERLRQMKGVPEEVLASDTFMALLEPVLRADLRLAETWEASPGRLTTPILALCGAHDDIDPHEDMLDWQHHTTKGFAIHTIPAGHFFLREQEERVVSAIVARLRTGQAG